MRCLTDNEIQQVIDVEMTVDKLKQCREHIAGCSLCDKKYNQQREVAESIKELINSSVTIPASIPEFKVPTTKSIPQKNIHRFPLWMKVAAVILPVAFVWKMTNNKAPVSDFKPTAEDIMLYENCKNVDANTAFQKNMITTTVSDENGKVIECTTN